MSLVKNFKRHLKSQPGVFITTGRREYFQTDEISGEVVFLQAPPREGVKLELKEFWQEKQVEDGIIRTVTQTWTEREYTLQEMSDYNPEVGYCFPFTLPLPQNCRISTNSAGWNIVATTDETTDLTLKVVPSRECLAIVSVLERKMRFKERKALRFCSDSGFMNFRFIPPEILQSELDFLVSAFRQEKDGTISATLAIKLSEKSIDDYFQNIINPDNIVKKNFQMHPSQILQQDGTPDINAISTIITPLIQEIIQQQ